MQRVVRPRPPILRALGSQDPPREISLAGERFERVDIYKHDSWAATARYRGPRGDVVCKFNRVQPLVVLPMKWLGRWLAARERAMLVRLAGVCGIPRECGPVTSDGRRLTNAVAHEYIEGQPLGSGERPDDAFFPRLFKLLEETHARGIAYVDLHKRENVVLGDDGRPYLVDFQVCFGLWSRWLTAVPPLRAILKSLQHLDMHCVAKHVRNQRPDQVALVAERKDAGRPWWINVHRFFGVPLRSLRRSLLVALRVRARGGEAASETYAEHALRFERSGSLSDVAS
jgi:hypothetical protein